MHARTRELLFGLMLLVSLPGVAYAQAAIAGVVKDTSGAVLPGVTIEGLSTDETHLVQLAWKEFDVPQCGYCQSGQILAAVALLTKQPRPSDDDN